MEISFKGKRALVTGAANGIGRGIATRLAECGATVVALDVSGDMLDKLKAEVPSVELLVVNLCDWDATARAIEGVRPIDLLVNNAGVAPIGPLASVTEDDCDKIFSVNIKSMINVTKVVVKDMIERKSPGAIVNLSSQASKAGLVDHTLYCATKGAVDAFTRAAALEYGPGGVRINCVNPTVVMTELGRKIWCDPRMGDPMLAKIPLRKFAEIDNVVDAVVFLLSDKAAMITGSCLPIKLTVNEPVGRRPDNALSLIEVALHVTITLKMRLWQLAVACPRIFATVDLNFNELEYLADHLLPQECRRLVAAAHFKSILMPKSIDEAEHAVPKDVPCVQLLLHWNSAEGEGRGETHEVLELRLRQMGKYELADWLGRTVFRQLGRDLEDSLEVGLKEVATDTATTPKNISLPTLVPIIEYSDPTEWLPFDTICLAILALLVIITLSLCTYLLCQKCWQQFRKTKRNLAKPEYYEMVDDGSDSEDKFDIRQHSTPM